MTQQTKYKTRFIETFRRSADGKDAFGINRDAITQIVGQVKEVVDMGVQAGAGSAAAIFSAAWPRRAQGMDRATADYMGYDGHRDERVGIERRF